jgi:hypothetical protein
MDTKELAEKHRQVLALRRWQAAVDEVNASFNGCPGVVVEGIMNMKHPEHTIIGALVTSGMREPCFCDSGKEYLDCCFKELTESQEPESKQEASPEHSRKDDGYNCTFLYFKRSGKWYEDGRGMLPSEHPLERKHIRDLNNGMPGLSSTANSFIVVVVPDDDCNRPNAYPRLLPALEAE